MDDFVFFEDGKFLGFDIFDTDFFKLVLLFGLNLFITTIIARLIYYPFNGKKKEFLFSFVIMSCVVFFLCFALKGFKFNTGVAIGLFALIGIIRFRTNPIPIKEMGYLFIIIGISLINAFSKKMSLYEIGFINTIALTILFFMEIFLHKKTLTKDIFSAEVIYGDIEKTKPEHRKALIEDITAQTGLKVERIKVGKINLKTREIELKVYYKNKL